MPNLEKLLADKRKFLLSADLGLAAKIRVQLHIDQILEKLNERTISETSSIKSGGFQANVE